MHYFLAKDNQWLKALKDELKEQISPEINHFEKLSMISISEDYSLSNSHLGFSTQALLNCKTIAEDSISLQVDQIIKIVKEKIKTEEEILLHAFSLTYKYGVYTKGRIEIVKEKLIKKLRKEGIRLNRKKPLKKSNFVQILLMPDKSLICSVITKNQMPRLSQLLSPFEGGFTTITEDKKAPSRAYRKIIEAQKILGHYFKPEEIVVDLGASPGGWSYIARKQGSKVIALDRSELAEDLMNDSQVTFIKGDAFKYMEEKIDWVISDIICEPKRILELIHRWVEAEKCQQFIFTIKFKGSEDYPILKQFQEVSLKLNYDSILRQLNANKNEVTFMGIKK